MKNENVVKEEVITALAQSVQRGGRSLGTVPGLMRRVVDENLWQDRLTPFGEHIQMSDFRQFVEGAFPQGLGTTLETLEALCAHEPSVLNYLAAVRDNKEGESIGPTNQGETRVDPNGNLIKADKFVQTLRQKEKPKRIYGKSVVSALSRLSSERPDLHKRVVAGELSANAAMLEAGFRKHKVAVAVNDPNSTAQTLRRFMSSDQIHELVQILDVNSTQSS